jgi:flagellar hook-associated protein 3 FlgL
VEKRIAECDENDTTKLASLTELQEQISTQIQLQKTVLTNALSGGITTCQKAQEKLNVACADHGSRNNRMIMTKNKLEMQKIDTDDAKSENEDADLGEAMVNFTEADLLYQAVLGATSKILGQSLLNFI